MMMKISSSTLTISSHKEVRRRRKKGVDWGGWRVEDGSLLLD